MKHHVCHCLKFNTVYLSIVSGLGSLLVGRILRFQLVCIDLGTAWDMKTCTKQNKTIQTNTCPCAAKSHIITQTQIRVRFSCDPRVSDASESRYEMKQSSPPINGILLIRPRSNPIGNAAKIYQETNGF